MARYKRIPQKIGNVVVFTAHRDLSDVCPGCGGYILKGHWYVHVGRETWHKRCRGLSPQLPPEPKAPARPVKQRTPAQEQKRTDYKARRRKEKEMRRAEPSR